DARKALWPAAQKRPHTKAGHMTAPISTLNRHRIPLGLPPVRRVFRDWINQANVVIGMFPKWFAQPQPDWPSKLRLTDFPLYDHAQSEVPSAECETEVA